MNRQTPTLRKFQEADRLRRERARAYKKMLEFEFHEEVEDRVEERVEKEFDDHYKRGYAEGVDRVRSMETEAETFRFIHDTMEKVVRKAIGGGGNVEDIASTLTYQMAGHLASMLSDPATYSVTNHVEYGHTLTSHVTVTMNLRSFRTTAMVSSDDMWGRIETTAMVSSDDMWGRIDG